jgi:hypothetical protein
MLGLYPVISCDDAVPVGRRPYQSVEKAIPGFFNCRLAKGASANLTESLALSGPANSGGPSLGRTRPFLNGG